jgi:hypothetical protein
MCASMGRRSEDIVHDSTGAEIEAEPDQSLAHFSRGVVGSKLHANLNFTRSRVARKRCAFEGWGGQFTQ